MRFHLFIIVAVVLCGGRIEPLATAQEVESKSDFHDAELLDNYRATATEKWEDEIRELEALDKPSDSDESILFIGSSSIRLWDTIEQDIAPYTPIRRGYGGAKFTDLAIYTKRLITPHRYRAMVVFVGNDVQGKDQDTPLEDFERLARYVVRVSRNHQPDAPIFLVEITPTPDRFDAWPKIRAANAILREVALTEANTHFVATAEYYLNSNNQPKTELFVEDQLHQNSAGYALWARIITRSLAAFGVRDQVAIAKP